MPLDTDLEHVGRIQRRPQAHKNSTVPGFPNLFFVHGLNTGYSSMVYMIESQLNYVVDALRAMRDGGIEAVEAKEDAFRTWNDAVQRRMPPTVWNSGGCSTWRHGRPADRSPRARFLGLALRRE